MYKIKLSIIILLMSLGVLLPTKAQTKDTSNVFSLSQVIDLANKNNNEILKSLAQVKGAKSEQLQASASFLPSVELSNTLYSTNDPLNAFGFKLQQGIVTQADFNPALLNDPGTVDHFNTQIKVEQPLINVDAWMGKSAANKKVKAMEFKSEYTESHIHFIIKQTYYALQLAQSKKDVIEKAYVATEAYLKMAIDNQEQGYLKEADVLSVKVRKLELEAQLKEAENQERNIKENLNFLMGREIGLPLTIADSIHKVDYLPNNNQSISGRADVLAMKYGLDARKQMKKSSAFSLAPRINAFGMYNMYDDDFGGFDADSWLVGINLQWKLFNGGKNWGKLNKAKADYVQAEIEYNDYLDKNNMELRQAVRNIDINSSLVNSYQTASEQSKETLRIRTNRYKEGLERTSDLLAAEAKSAESELKYLHAIYNFNIAVFKYQLLTSEAAQ